MQKPINLTAEIAHYQPFSKILDWNTIFNGKPFIPKSKVKFVPVQILLL